MRRKNCWAELAALGSQLEMVPESTGSTSGLGSMQGRSLTCRAADYFGMSGQAEFIAAASLFALMIVFKLLNMMSYRFDSDESQHMHVIWAWARGFGKRAPKRANAPTTPDGAVQAPPIALVSAANE